MANWKVNILNKTYAEEVADQLTVNNADLIYPTRASAGYIEANAYDIGFNVFWVWEPSIEIYIPADTTVTAIRVTVEWNKGSNPIFDPLYIGYNDGAWNPYFSSYTSSETVGSHTHIVENLQSYNLSDVILQLSGHMETAGGQPEPGVYLRYTKIELEGTGERPFLPGTPDAYIHDPGASPVCPAMHVNTLAGADPIKLLNGEKLEAETDIALQTPSGLLAFERAFRQSHLNTEVDPTIRASMGLGWSHNHNYLADFSQSGVLKIEIPGGGIVHLEPDPEGYDFGVYRATAGSTAEYKNGILYTSDGSEYHFQYLAAQRWLLEKRVWPNGQTWTYQYTGTTYRRLQEIADDYGNTLIFAYKQFAAGEYYVDGDDQSSLLWRIGDHTTTNLEGTTPTGRYVEFTYTQEKANGVVESNPRPLLHKVRDVLGNEWVYNYYGQSVGQSNPDLTNYLIGITSPSVDQDGDDIADGAIILKEIDYTSSGGTISTLTERLGKQGSGNFLKQIDYAFQPNGEDLTTETLGGRVKSYLFDNGVYRGVEDGNGNQAFNLVDDNHRPLLQIDGNGHGVRTEWSEDGKTLQRVITPESETAFSYDHQNRLQFSTDAHGRQTLYLYEDENEPRQPTQILVTKGKNLINNSQMDLFNFEGLYAGYPTDWELAWSDPIYRLPYVHTGNHAYYVEAPNPGDGIQSDRLLQVGNTKIRIRVFVISGYATVEVVNYDDSFPSYSETIGTASGPPNVAPGWYTLETTVNLPANKADGTGNYRIQVSDEDPNAIFYVDALEILDADDNDALLPITDALNGEMEVPGKWSALGNGTIQHTSTMPEHQAAWNSQWHHVYAELSYDTQAGQSNRLVLMQMDELEAGKTYSVLARVRVVAGEIKMRFFDAERLASDSTGGEYPDGIWQTLFLSYTAQGSDQISLDFVAEGTETAKFYLDDVYVFDDEILSWQQFERQYTSGVLSKQIDKVVDPETGNYFDPLSSVEKTFYTSGNAQGMLQSVIQVGPGNPSTTYTYDDYGRVIQAQKSSIFGSCEISYTVYDDAGQVVASICNYDPDGNPEPTTATEAAALVALVGNPDKNQVTAHAYDSLGRRVATTANAGTSFARTSRTIYDALGRVVRTIQNYVPQGSSAPRDWIWVTDHWEDGGSNTIAHGTDLIDNIISDVAYNARGLVRLRRDVLGNVTLFGYDDADHLVKTVQNAATPGYNNDASGDIDLDAYPENTSLVDQDIVTTQTYDAAGSLVKTQDAAGRVTLTGLDALNRPIRVIRNATQPAYDMAADPTLESYDLSTDPDQDQVSETAYDSLGRVIRTRTLLENRPDGASDEVWDTTLYGYDTLGRQVRTIQHAASPEGTYLADLSDYIVSTNPDEDMVSETVYDNQGRVLYTSDVDDNTHWQAYDEFSHVVKSIQNASYVSGSPTPDDDTYIPSSAADLDLISQTIYDESENYKDKVVETINALGNVTHFVYDPDTHRRIRTVQNYTATSDPAAWVWSTAIDPDGRWEDGTGVAIDHGSDNDENLITGTEYDKEGRVLKSYDTRYNITLYGYDSLGRRVKSVQNASNPSYDAENDPSLANYTPDVNAEIDQDRITQTVYDLAGRVEQTIDTVNRVNLSIFDKLGRRIRTVSNYTVQNTSPEQWVWTTATDPDGRWEDGTGVAIDHGSEYDQNIISDTVYNKAGQVESTRDARGTSTGFIYDAAGRRIQTIRAKDLATLETTAYTCYGKAGRVLRTIQNWDDTTTPDVWDTQGDWVFDPTTHGMNNDENLITEFSYDKAGRRISTTNPAGDTSLTTYFKNGQVDFVTDPEATVTHYSYDRLRRRIQVVQGYMAQATEPDQWVWSTTNNRWEDGSSNAIAHGDHNDENIIVQVVYDKGGRMRSMLDPRGKETTHDYDKLNRRTKLTNPANTEWITAYADDGQKTSVTMTYPGLSTGGTYVVQRDFDRLGRLSSMQHGNPTSTPDVQFTYDAAGNRVEMTEYNGIAFSNPVRQTQYAYDERNRLIQVGFDSDGDTLIEESVIYAYNLVGNRTTLTIPDGAGGTLNISYDYDDLGRLVSLTDWDTQESTFGYDDAGRHIQTQRPNGLTSDYEYDPAGHLTNLTHENSTSVLAEFDYVVDGRGNRVQANERLMKPDASVVEKTIVYDYDALSRLIFAEYRDGFNMPSGTVLDTYTYGYDRAGNLVNKNGVTRTYNIINQMTYDGTHTSTYDANGNLVSVGSESYEWDRGNRMISAPGNTSYKYDGLGNRIQQTVASMVTDYLNDVQPGLTQMIAATTSSNTEYFIHGPRGIHAHALSGPGSNGAIWGQAIWGQAVWGDTGSGSTPEWQYLLQDGLGSVRAEADANADILANRGYDPYGLPIDLNGSFASPFGFTGEQTDGNDQVYLRARYYTPDMGIFTALDPWEGIPQRPMSLNGYLYVEGNTINRTDGSGLCPLRYEDSLVARTDSEQCYQMRDRLQTWGVNVTFEETALSPCLPEAVQQELTVNQRWTTGEMRAIYNAFRIFGQAQSTLSIPYAFPLTNPITLKKTQENVPDGAFAFTSGREIRFSPSEWGTESRKIESFNYVTHAQQYRAWIVLHEFSHIFTLDRAEAIIQAMASSPKLGFPIVSPRIYVERYLSQEISNLGFRDANSEPTDYSLAGEAFTNIEYIIEAVTGTLWNAGYRLVSYDASAGGRTGGSFENVANIFAPNSSDGISVSVDETPNDNTDPNRIYWLPIPAIVAGTSLSEWALIRIIEGVVE